MLFSEERFERYAMEVEKISQGGLGQTGRWYVDVDEVGKALGFSSHESRLFAHLLETEDWAQIDYKFDPPKLRLTLKGYREIAKLHWSPWRRWVHRNLPIVISILALAVSIVSLVLKFIFP